MMYERIVSTGIYYWDCENITDSRLSFRAAVERPLHQSGDDNGVRAAFGLENRGALNQVLGAAETRVGRAVAFPNIL